MTRSRIVAEFELDGPGKRHGFSALVPFGASLRLRLHPDPRGRGLRRAWADRAAGRGNHGDEWEGQIILSDLLQSLQPWRRGRPGDHPALRNLPAALAGARTSPLDDGNLEPGVPWDGRRHGDAATGALHRNRTDPPRRLAAGPAFRRLVVDVFALHPGDRTRRPGAVGSACGGRSGRFGAPYAYLQGRAEGQGGMRTLSDHG